MAVSTEQMAVSTEQIASKPASATGLGAQSPEPSPWQRFFAGLGPWDTANELTRFCFGALFFATVGPFVFSSALLSTLWEAADRGFSGGVFLSGQEQTGFLLGRLVPWLNRLTHPLNKRLVKNPQDSYMVNAVLLFGAVIPALFVLCGLHTLRNGGQMSWLLCLAYHQFRLGPFVMNFGWVYALSHREGHAIAAHTGMWRAPYDKSGPLRYVFNYWVGLFYGVTPASFDVGHSIIHHRYSNDENDTITNADMPRDNWVSYVSYAPRWLLYSLNVTTFTHFVAQGNWKYSVRTAVGSAWYVGFCWLVTRCFGASFATMYIAYPLMEQVMLLMMANWSWHAFLDPTDPTNESVLSTTILNGQINVRAASPRPEPSPGATPSPLRLHPVFTPSLLSPRPTRPRRTRRTPAQRGCDTCTCGWQPLSSVTRGATPGVTHGATPGATRGVPRGFPRGAGAQRGRPRDAPQVPGLALVQHGLAAQQAPRRLRPGRQRGRRPPAWLRLRLH